MKRLVAVAFSLFIMSTVPTSLAARGDIVQITIKGAGLTTPIEITDLRVGEF